MGLLVNGEWVDQWYDTEASDGAFVRDNARFRNWVSVDGSEGPSGRAGFKAEAGRYHLYVSHACPWAHRTLIYRALKGLESLIPVSVVHPLMRDEGWTFNSDFKGCTGDPLYAHKRLYDLYLQSDPKTTGRVTVPVLWDTKEECIVSNESSEIIRMFNSAFDHLGAKSLDLYPPKLREAIDAMNLITYEAVNNGVYKAGFATTQAAYESALVALFDTLDQLERLLTDQRYLVGGDISEADWRLFPTLVRFDAVYVGHFKCNIRRIADYPALSAYVRDLYQQAGIASTLHMDHIKAHYYRSHPTLNPSGVVPVGPLLDFEAAHGRALLGPSASAVLM